MIRSSPWALDSRLGDAESVDAVPDRLDGLPDGLALDLDPRGVAEADAPLAPALVDLPVVRREGRLQEVLTARG